MIPLRDNVPAANVPIAMWAIVALNTLVFYGEFSLTPKELDVITHQFGVVPARFWPVFDATALPSLLINTFMHGGLLHLLGNMWTLYLFGDNVEDRMGPVRFTLFYLLCGVLASLAHVVTNLGSEIPALGASGAIAGVMGAYALMFPRAGIVLLIPILFYPFFFQVSAWLYLGGWFAVQYWMATQPMDGSMGGVAFWAHIGGFVAGVVLHRFFVRRATDEPHVEPTQILFENAWR